MEKRNGVGCIKVDILKPLWSERERQTYSDGLVYISTCCLRECGSEQSAIGEVRKEGWKIHSAVFYAHFLILKKSFWEKETRIIPLKKDKVGEKEMWWQNNRLLYYLLWPNYCKRKLRQCVSKTWRHCDSTCGNDIWQKQAWLFKEFLSNSGIICISIW